MEPLVDIHTHNLTATGAVISVRPWQLKPLPGRVYSVGIHPWDSADVTPEMMAELETAAAHEQVVAIGECGVDALRGACVERQVEIAQAHIRLSERLGLPLILHCVRAVNHIVALYRLNNPSQPWVVHDFRGSAGAAKALLACRGICLSFGERFPEAALAVTPVERILVETDESAMPIESIAARVAAAKGCSPADLAAAKIFA